MSLLEALLTAAARRKAGRQHPAQSLPLYRRLHAASPITFSFGLARANANDPTAGGNMVQAVGSPVEQCARRIHLAVVRTLTEKLRRARLARRGAIQLNPPRPLSVGLSPEGSLTTARSVFGYEQLALVALLSEMSDAQRRAMYARISHAGGAAVMDSPAVKLQMQLATAAHAHKVMGPHPAVTPELRKQLLALGVKKFPAAEHTDVQFHAKGLTGEHVHKEAVVTWRDKRGKLQAAYSKQFLEENARKKWERLQALEPRFSEINYQLRDKLRSPDERTRATATAALIIAATGLRPGGAAVSKELRRYGVTTLPADKVRVTGDTVDFSFVGKSGQHNVAQLKDAELARAIAGFQQSATARQGRLFPVESSAVRAMLPKGIKPKDFRTLLATKSAESYLQEHGHVTLTGNTRQDRLAVARVLKAASEHVAKRLNNTAAVARASYVHPRVFDNWLKSLGPGVKESLIVGGAA